MIPSSYPDMKLCLLKLSRTKLASRMPQADPTDELQRALSERILVLDGAMGTTIRGYGLSEAEARGERYADTDKDLLNNGDILSITRPDVIGDIHKRFYEAGSDICETNT